MRHGDIRALTFDVFGTTVDWRGTITREGERLGAAKGIQVDWKAVADRWGRIAAKASLARARLPVIDGLLAATALDRNLTLVTRNTRDVAATGVPVFNPWGA